MGGVSSTLSNNSPQLPLFNATGFRTIVYGRESSYEGEVNERNMRHGKGMMTYEDGSVYVGNWFQGLPHDFGVILATGLRYEGWWDSGQKQGRGYERTSKARFFGIYVEGVKDGDAISIRGGHVFYERWSRGRLIDQRHVFDIPKTKSSETFVQIGSTGGRLSNYGLPPNRSDIITQNPNLRSRIFQAQHSHGFQPSHVEIQNPSAFSNARSTSNHAANLNNNSTILNNNNMNTPSTLIMPNQTVNPFLNNNISNINNSNSNTQANQMAVNNSAILTSNVSPQTVVSTGIPVNPPPMLGSHPPLYQTSSPMIIPTLAPPPQPTPEVIQRSSCTSATSWTRAEVSYLLRILGVPTDARKRISRGTLQALTDIAYLMECGIGDIQIARLTSKCASEILAAHYRQALQAFNALEAEKQIRALDIPIAGKGTVTLVRRLGKGAFGAVWLGRWAPAGRVAVKMFMNRLHGLRDLVMEARVLRRVTSNRVARLLGVTINPPALLIEWVDGCSLFERIHAPATSNNGGGHHDASKVKLSTLSTRRVIDVALGISRAMNDLHDSGILYCDLKSTNVLLRRPGANSGVGPVAAVAAQLAMAVAAEKRAENINQNNASILNKNNNTNNNESNKLNNSTMTSTQHPTILNNNQQQAQQQHSYNLADNVPAQQVPTNGNTSNRISRQQLQLQQNGINPSNVQQTQGGRRPLVRRPQGNRALSSTAIMHTTADTANHANNDDVNLNLDFNSDDFIDEELTSSDDESDADAETRKILMPHGVRGSKTCHPIVKRAHPRLHHHHHSSSDKLFRRNSNRRRSLDDDLNKHNEDYCGSDERDFDDKEVVDTYDDIMVLQPVAEVEEEEESISGTQPGSKKELIGCYGASQSSNKLHNFTSSFQKKTNAEKMTGGLSDPDASSSLRNFMDDNVNNEDINESRPSIVTQVSQGAPKTVVHHRHQQLNSDISIPKNANNISNINNQIGNNGSDEYTWSDDLLSDEEHTLKNNHHKDYHDHINHEPKKTKQSDCNLSLNNKLPSSNNITSPKASFNTDKKHQHASPPSPNVKYCASEHISPTIENFSKSPDEPLSPTLLGVNSRMVDDDDEEEVRLLVIEECTEEDDKLSEHQIEDLFSHGAVVSIPANANPLHSTETICKTENSFHREGQTQTQSHSVSVTANNTNNIIINYQQDQARMHNSLLDKISNSASLQGSSIDAPKLIDILPDSAPSDQNVSDIPFNSSYSKNEVQPQQVHASLLNEPFESSLNVSSCVQSDNNINSPSTVSIQQKVTIKTQLNSPNQLPVPIYSTLNTSSNTHQTTTQCPATVSLSSSSKLQNQSVTSSATVLSALMQSNAHLGEGGLLPDTLKQMNNNNNNNNTISNSIIVINNNINNNNINNMNSSTVVISATTAISPPTNVHSPSLPTDSPSLTHHQPLIEENFSMSPTSNSVVIAASSSSRVPILAKEAISRHADESLKRLDSILANEQKRRSLLMQQQQQHNANAPQGSQPSTNIHKNLNAHFDLFTTTVLQTPQPISPAPQAVQSTSSKPQLDEFSTTTVANVVQASPPSIAAAVSSINPPYFLNKNSHSNRKRKAMKAAGLSVKRSHGSNNKNNHNRNYLLLDSSLLSGVSSRIQSNILSTPYYQQQNGGGQSGAPGTSAFHPLDAILAQGIKNPRNRRGNGRRFNIGHSNRRPKARLLDSGSEGDVASGDQESDEDEEEEPIVKLCDLGLASCAADDLYAPYRGAGVRLLGCVGTQQWMAPEVIRGEGTSRASDVFSFGIVLWEMLCRRIPYNELSPVQITARVGYLATCPPLPSDAPGPLIGVMLDCLNPVPHKRPPFRALSIRLSQMQRLCEGNLFSEVSRFVTGLGSQSSSEEDSSGSGESDSDVDSEANGGFMKGSAFKTCLHCHARRRGVMESDLILPSSMMNSVNVGDISRLGNVGKGLKELDKSKQGCPVCAKWNFGGKGRVNNNNNRDKNESGFASGLFGNFFGGNNVNGNNPEVLSSHIHQNSSATINKITGDGSIVFAPQQQVATSSPFDDPTFKSLWKRALSENVLG